VLQGRLPRGIPGSAINMSISSFFSRLRAKRTDQVEQRRNEAILKANALGATPEQARRAGERAARGNTNAAITGSINSGG
jgi:hypothetical protein